MRRLIGSALLTVCVPALAAAQPIVVASKSFTESYILGEVVAQLLEGEGFTVDRKLGLGGTKICYDALTVGDVDVYVEYTGTIAEAIKDLDGEPTLARLADALAPDGIEMLPPLGFNNTYALALAPTVASSRNLGHDLGVGASRRPAPGRVARVPGTQRRLARPHGGLRLRLDADGHRACTRLPGHRGRCHRRHRRLLDRWRA